MRNVSATFSAAGKKKITVFIPEMYTESRKAKTDIMSMWEYCKMMEYHYR